MKGLAEGYHGRDGLFSQREAEIQRLTGNRFKPYTPHPLSHARTHAHTEREREEEATAVRSSSKGTKATRTSNVSN